MAQEEQVDYGEELVADQDQQEAEALKQRLHDSGVEEVRPLRFTMVTFGVPESHEKDVTGAVRHKRGRESAPHQHCAILYTQRKFKVFGTLYGQHKIQNMYEYSSHRARGSAQFLGPHFPVHPRLWLPPFSMQMATDGSGEQLTEEEKKERDGRSIFLGNVHFDATAEQLHELFCSCGTINQVTIKSDKNNNPKGFAYIEFLEPDAVEAAVKLNGTELLGRAIKVNPKRTNVPGKKGRGRGRGGMMMGFMPMGRGGMMPVMMMMGGRGRGRGRGRGGGGGRGAGSGAGGRGGFSPY